MTSRIANLAEYASLIERLNWLAQHQAESVAVRFEISRNQVGDQLTFAELDLAARSFAVKLTNLGLNGQRIVIMLPTGRDYLIAFFGCLYAGSVAIPSFPPRPNRSHERIESIVADARPAAIVLPDAHTQSSQSQINVVEEAAEIAILDAREMCDANPSQWVDPGKTQNDLAMLQYTSGSTATPKGVMVSHGNILHNQQMLVEALRPDQSTVGLSWLPLFHDMGLIGGALTPICAGFPVILMSPESFLMRPFRWLSAITENKVNWSVAPNFAYEYCVRKVSPDQARQLDLSSWSAAIVGAEPVRSHTLESFAAHFSDAGFSMNAFYPCYGLAEATLFVTGGSRDAEPTYQAESSDHKHSSTDVEADVATGAGARIVSCGWSWCDADVVIVDAETGVLCPAGEQGEIWVSGPNVAQGYWERPEESSSAFRATLENDSRRFLRTGDLGFINQGELFITGRLKNMIVVAGRNIHLEDVENTVCTCHPAVHAGRCAAVNIEQGQVEKLVLIIEVDRKTLAEVSQQQLQSEIRAAVTQQHEVPINEIVFTKSGRIARTSSGKIRRNVCRDKYLAGEFRYQSSAPPSASQQI